MRIYMKRKRALDRIERLKQRKIQLLKRFDEEPMMKYFIKKEEVGIAIPPQIEKCLETVKECDGLLKMRTNSYNLGGTRKP